MSPARTNPETRSHNILMITPQSRFWLLPLSSGLQEKDEKYSGDLRVVDILPHVFVAMESGRWEAPGRGWSRWLLVRNAATLRLALKESRILQGDKMVSILINFVKLIGHFLLCKTCPVYHRKRIGSQQFGYVSISFNSSDIKAVITLSRSDDLVLNVKSQSPSVYGAPPWHPAVPVRASRLCWGLTWEAETPQKAWGAHL